MNHLLIIFNVFLTRYDIESRALYRGMSRGELTKNEKDA